MKYPVEEALPDIKESIQCKHRLVLLQALPNSGKTKWLPAQLALGGYNVLFLSPQVTDLPDMHDRLSKSVNCSVAAGQHMRLYPKEPRWRSVNEVYVLSVGLGAQWVHDKNCKEYSRWWNSFDVVLCDEAHFMEVNYIYGHLVTVLMDTMPKKTFVLMSGTLPESLGKSEQCQVLT